MFRCPRCQNELPANARFCNNCGFNQTNARLETMRTVGPNEASEPSQVRGVNHPGSMGQVKEDAKQNRLASAGNGHVQEQSLSSEKQWQGQSEKPMISGAYVPETPQVTMPPTKGNSLTGRYIAGQNTRYEAALPTVPQTPNPLSSIQSSLPTVSNQFFEWELGLPDTLTVSDDAYIGNSVNKSMIATNSAAEQWHKSWKDRQRAEAGPAVNVSRGQASVPEPLLVMQHSIARMRAIVLPKNQGKESNFGFWIIIVLMFCLFVGLVSYIASTYLPGVQLASQSITTINGQEPTLSLQTAKSTSFAPGQSIQVQGTNFGSLDQIIFLLDTTTLNGTDGKPASITTDSHGTFKTSVSIPRSQLAGQYALQAQDNHTGQHAFLDLNVLPASTTNTSSLILSQQGLPVSSLSFATIVGKKDASEKQIDITNSGATALQWTVSTETDDNIGWLLINDHQSGGQLDTQQSVGISFSVLTEGLPVSSKGHPYKGDVIFTVVNQGQVVLPVELQVADTGVEVVVTPNPLTALISSTAPGTCQDTGLTLINLNNTVINWTIKPGDDFNAQHIHVDGKTQESDILQASGYTGDSRVIHLTCVGVQVGDTYILTVYYNGQTESVPVSILRST